MPEDRFRNWIGGFEHINAAIDYASAGGIPMGSVISGGKIAKVRMEHWTSPGFVDTHRPTFEACSKA